MNDLTDTLQAAVQAAATQRTPLKITGGNSKAFYGRAGEGAVLAVAQHQGIISYEPTELVVTARAGTTLQELEKTLAEQGQGLGFEPPQFNATATLGGTIACGFSGPARPYTGAARDFVLGVTCLNGKGEKLRFGGQVMKNVAGYDVSRLMVGALGTLGVLLDVSCKVLPLPRQEITLVLPATEQEALQQMVHWGNQTVPLTASCFDGEYLYLRLSGLCVDSAQQKMPGELHSAGQQFWQDLREQQLAFFRQSLPLWRLSVPPTTPQLALAGQTLIEWGGGLRWLYSELPAATIRDRVAAVGGHATLFRGRQTGSEVFHPLPPALANLHRRLKHEFDPYGILNPKRMVAEW